jgi:hypothetical protein
MTLKSLLIWFLFLLAAGFAALHGPLYFYLEWQAPNYQPVNATVTDISSRIEYSSQGENRPLKVEGFNYYWSYRYDYGAYYYLGEAKRSFGDREQIGQTMRVYVNPEFPSVSRLDNTASTRFLLLYGLETLAGVGFLLFTAFKLILFMFKRMRRTKVLKQDG